MTHKRHKKTTPKFFIMLTIVCVVIACVFFVAQEQKLDEIHQETAVLEQQYEALLNEQQRVEYMIEYAHSTDYLLQYAREKLGYVRESDIKFNIEGQD